MRSAVTTSLGVAGERRQPGRARGRGDTIPPRRPRGARGLRAALLPGCLDGRFAEIVRCPADAALADHRMPVGAVGSPVAGREVRDDADDGECDRAEHDRAQPDDEHGPAVEGRDGGVAGEASGAEVNPADDAADQIDVTGEAEDRRRDLDPTRQLPPHRRWLHRLPFRWGAVGERHVTMVAGDAANTDGHERRSLHAGSARARASPARG